ncbi:MAG: biotin transporter BioY [Candidatus Eisenbacteria bacterium]|uniref:Biotin transporter n=1 Tax=Eiseniibacteriota bacterium TaxID=2212470 RepID=A0A538TZL7_UNCEI|nr:MAG: biotin transporter BioY [Candidatus Eisenbacteria bacterium]
MPAVRTLTLADVAWPRAGLLRDTLLILAASVVTALAARVAIPLPWSPVPLTGQTFGVLLSGAVLGARRGFIAQLVYLAEGALGLPVFAGGAAGATILAGPTAGYLLAFPLAAALTGALAERGWDRRYLSTLGALLGGSALVFAGGLAGLARFVPADRLLVTGLLPFVPGDLLKCALAAAAFPAAWRGAHRHSGNDA